MMINQIEVRSGVNSAEWGGNAVYSCEFWNVEIKWIFKILTQVYGSSDQLSIQLLHSTIPHEIDLIDLWAAV